MARNSAISRPECRNNSLEGRSRGGAGTWRAQLRTVCGTCGAGSAVFPVPVYKWAPPEDAEPLREAIRDLALGKFNVVLFTSSVQVHHLFRFADEMGQHQEAASALRRAVVGSIGPVTSETLREYGITPHLEPSHPRMGFLVKEAAERSAELLQQKK